MLNVVCVAHPGKQLERNSTNRAIVYSTYSSTYDNTLEITVAQFRTYQVATYSSKMKQLRKH